MVTISRYAKMIESEYTDEKLPNCVHKPMTIFSANFLCINYIVGLFHVHSLNCDCSGYTINHKFDIDVYKNILQKSGKCAVIQYTFHCILGDTCSE